MSGGARLLTGFIGGILLMAAAVGVYAAVDNNSGSSSGDSVQNVATAAPKATASDSNGNASNVTVTGDCMSAADVYEQVRPSVVEVDIVGGSQFNGTIQGTGTGIVLDDDGHILTNNHVVDQATTVNVKFSDGATVAAQVVGTDSQNDLAVIKIDPSQHDLQPATLGDSSDVRIGDTALAIGSPFNLEGSLTEGIISGLDRTHAESDNGRPLRGLIQTDAAINPGNSGGPLLDCRGEVIGINTLLENPTGQTVNVGVGFAVAINTAKSELSQLEASQTVSHAWLGIAGTDVTPTLKEQLNLTVDQGVYVTLVSAGGPAEKAGLQGAFSSASQANGATEPVAGGDVIVSADGKDMTSLSQLATYLDQNKKPGDTVELGVVRDGNDITITATLAEWPSA